MEKNQVLENTLYELNKTTGLDLSIQINENGQTEEAITLIRLLSSAFKEKYNKDYVIRQWLMGKTTDIEMLDSCKKLHVSMEEKRILYLISVNPDNREEVLTIIRNLFPYNSNLWSFEVEPGKILLIQTIERTKVKNHTLASQILDTIRSELLIEVKIAYSRMVETLLGIRDAYKEVCFTMEVGNVFQYEEDIFGFDQLGVGRLLHTVPLGLCQDYLMESFHNFTPNGVIQAFDPEILKTVNCFLDNNLNIAETSRKLHVHRNTLIYRLDQIEKEIGLDVRQFNHAMTYKIASLIMQKISAK